MKELATMNMMKQEIKKPFEQAEEYNVTLDHFAPKTAYEVCKRCVDVIFSLLALCSCSCQCALWRLL